MKARAYGINNYLTQFQKERDLDCSRRLSYTTAIDNNLEKIFKLEEQGHEIQWSATEKWCTINGEVINMPKRVYEIRKYMKENNITVL